VHSAGKEVICSLMLDEMSIRKAIEFDDKQFSAYVDMGTEITSEDLPPATSALVFMVVCLNSNWKVPVGYFFYKQFNRERKGEFSDIMCK
jgi:hypothetical protein